MGILKVDVAAGIHWIEIPAAGLRILCGCPPDAVKHLIKRGLILKQEIKGVTCETGPNTILLSDLPIQNGEFANLAEFPVLQMLYLQGTILPGHPNNTGRKPMLIGSADQLDSQMRYIYRGNYGLVSREEIMEAGVPAEQASDMMRLKLAFAFGRIQPTYEFLDSRILGEASMDIAPGVSLRRLETNVFEFGHGGEVVTVDLNLRGGKTYECPYPLGYRRFVQEYFSIIHSGEGDGWDASRPTMSSIITYQGRIYLIDAGPQLSHIMAALGIGIEQVDGIFHTHGHDDHFAGLTVLMRAGRRINYYATPLVRTSVAKKLTALLGMEEDHFVDFFNVCDLEMDTWSDIEGLEVMPVFSPHPVETNLFIFRTLSGDGYRSYAHFADIVSMDVLERMVTDQPDQPGLDRLAFERVRKAYMVPVDVKKIDVGGGLIHGAATDFRSDATKRILLAHRAGELTAVEKEIGSSAAFGTTDILVAGQSEGLRRHAYSYLEAHLPGVPLHQLRMLVNHPISEINPGAIILKEGEHPREVLLLLSGRVERIRTRDDLFGYLPAGAMIGDQAILEQRSAAHTYRASSFLRVLHLPPSLYAEIVRRNKLLEHRRHASVLSKFLDTTDLFGNGLPIAVLGRIIDGAVEHRFEAGEEIEGVHLQVLNIIRDGSVERSLGDRVLDVLRAREVFGEEGAIFNVPYLFRLRATQVTHVVQIPGKLIEDVPILRWKLLENHQQRIVRSAPSVTPASKVIWDDTISIHVARMDRHHLKLVEIANAVIENLPRDGNRKSLLSVFDALIDYARYHFEAEEKLMASYAYPGLEMHRVKHRDLLLQVSKLRDQITAGKVPNQAEFQGYFESWLISHIREDDRKYGAFLNSKGLY